MRELIAKAGTAKLREFVAHVFNLTIKEPIVLKGELLQFSSLSFEDAVRLFKSWGFRVEPGPRPEEVSLIIEAPDHRTYCVYPASQLPQLAAIALRVRIQNGEMYEASYNLRRRGLRDASSASVPLSIGDSWTLLL